MKRLRRSMACGTKWAMIAVMASWLTAARAEVKMSALFSDNMVLQSHQKDPVWGTADPQEKVTVTLGHMQATTTADAEGQWRVEIGPLDPGGPFELTVAGKNMIRIRDVMVGQVWLCSGQSNMEFSVGPQLHWWETGVENYKDVIANANYPMIRMFTVDRAVAGKPQHEVTGSWALATPQMVAQFSAVGYFFGLNLYEAMHEPIGLIHSSWGGTPLESWSTLPTLETHRADADLEMFNRWEASEKSFAEDFGKYKDALDSWRKASDAAEALGETMPAAPEPPRDPRTDPRRPASLYNGMIAPLMPYRIEGAIWYQGESNAHRALQYRTLFPAMIRDWRKAWGEGDFPFLFVQLAAYQNTHPPSNWPLLRESQMMALAEPKTAMVVTIDIGSPEMVHPRNKQEVGRRLALAARAVAYREDVAFSGPQYASMQVEGKKIRLHFTHTDGGLVAGSLLGTPRNLEGFEIAGPDHKFVEGAAEIDGDTVVVKGKGITQPVAVRYGWLSYPICNLFNEAALPASPFRTDDWPE